MATLLSPRNAIPRNLREGIYRGGRRPIDIFWRVSAGIAGTPMPASGPAAEGAQGTLTQQEIWQIVDYVQSLPYEPASQPQTKPLLNTASVSTGE
jgi:mono/diheme cytochrome c family protein